MSEGYKHSGIGSIDDALISRKVIELSGGALKDLPAPNPLDFVGQPGYIPELVEEDMKEVARLKGIFVANEERDPSLKQSKEFAAAFEALIMINAELCNWFGPDATTICVSEYDDIKNGVDFVIKFSDGVMIAVDVTASGRGLNKKFGRIEEEINSGKLANLKYFYDENTGERGMLKDIPRVIIAADGKTINGLGELWLGSKKDKYDKKSKQFSLERHPIQMQILEEIKLQLEFFIEYAAGRGAVVDKYKDVLKKIKEIMEDKPAELREARGFEKDRMFVAIWQQIKSLGVVA